VRVFSGAALPALVELASFFAYVPGFTGGVRVAVGDVNGDGRLDIVTGPGPGGGPHVRVFSGAALPALVELTGFYAFTPAFTGGVYVAAGDVNGDGAAELIVGADAGGGPHVRVFGEAGLPALVERASFFAYAPTFTGGVRVSVGNVNGTGLLDIVTGPGPGGGPHVRAFTGGGVSLPISFMAY
jgi:FG-GAP repeat